MQIRKCWRPVKFARTLEKASGATGVRLKFTSWCSPICAAVHLFRCFFSTLPWLSRPSRRFWYSEVAQDWELFSPVVGETGKCCEDEAERHRALLSSIIVSESDMVETMRERNCITQLVKLGLAMVSTRIKFRKVV